jgi:CheY-like chemotaxis protein
MHTLDDHQHTVLVVDDYPGLQEAFVVMLEHHGYRAAWADSGSAALNQLRAGLRPCLVLLDVGMPDMDGAEVRARMADDPALHDIAVVFLSGGHEVVEASDESTVAMLLKPIEPAALFAAIAEHARCPT